MLLVSCISSNDKKYLIVRWSFLICILLLCFLFVLLVCIWYYIFPNPYSYVSADEWDYGVVIDMGSGGSRVHIFQWCSMYNIPVQPSPVGSLSYWFKSETAFTLIKDPDEALNSLNTLLSYAVSKLNSVKASINKTPLIIYATGGLRSKSNEEITVIMDDIRILVKTNYEFITNDDWIKTISPKTEAIFDWISTQQSIVIVDDYNKQFSKFSSVTNGVNDIDPYSISSTIGIIDIGGESTEIAYETNQNYRTNTNSLIKDITEFTDDDGDGISDLYFNNTIYKVYSRGFDGFGHTSFKVSYQFYVWQNYQVISETENKTVIYDPCGLNNIEVRSFYSLSSKPMYLLGGADIEECTNAMRNVFNFTSICPYSFCTINGLYEPPIDNQLLLGINTPSELREYFNFKEQIPLVQLQSIFTENLFVSVDNVDENDVVDFYNANVEILFVYLLCTEGFGLSPNSTQLLFNDVILFHDYSVSWALGAMQYIKEINLL